MSGIKGFDEVVCFPSRPTPCEWCGARSYMPTHGGGDERPPDRFCDRACRQAWERDRFEKRLAEYPPAPFGKFSAAEFIRMFPSLAKAEEAAGVRVGDYIREKRHIRWWIADEIAVKAGLHPAQVWGDKWWAEAGWCPTCQVEELDPGGRCKECTRRRAARNREKKKLRKQLAKAS